MSDPHREAPPKTARATLAARIGRSWAALPRWARLVLSSIALVSSLGMAFSVGAYMTLRAAVSSPEIVVPNVVDLDARDAQRALDDLGLKPEISGSRHEADVPAGKVLEQLPVAGSTTKPGRPVRLVLSLGAGEAIVPDLAGQSLRTAQQALRVAGLKVRQSASAHHPSTALGRVIGQNPPAGTAAYPGDSVSVLVSAGPLPRAYVMPNVRGRTLAEVTRALGNAGFVRVRERTANGEPARPAMIVKSQDPPAGRRVTTDDRILLEAAEPWLVESSP